MSDCTIEPNQDVTGTGIRISIYALCLSSSIFDAIVKQMVNRDMAAEFTSALNGGLQLQGLALLFTAIYETFRQKLTLFHAVCILHLITMLGYGMVPKSDSQGGRPGQKRFVVVVIMSVTFTAAFLAFACYLWATAPTFGSQPECNADTVYVVFGIRVPAANAVFRYIFLVVLVAGALNSILMWLAAGSVLSWVFGFHRSDQARRMVLETGYFVPSVRRRVKFTDKRAKRLANIATINPVMWRLAVTVYLIVTLEQTVASNNVSEEEGEWTFGQVLALFVMLGVASEFLNIILARMDQREARKEAASRHAGSMGRGGSASDGGEMDGAEYQEEDGEESVNLPSGADRAMLAVQHVLANPDENLRPGDSLNCSRNSRQEVDWHA